jgi:hypothetical protein
VEFDVMDFGLHSSVAKDLTEDDDFESEMNGEKDRFVIEVYVSSFKNYYSYL